MLTQLRDKWQAHLKNTRHKHGLQTFGYCNNTVTCVVADEQYLGYGLVYHVVNSTTTKAGTPLLASILYRTIPQLRSPRFTHLGECVKVTAPHGCLSSLFLSG